MALGKRKDAGNFLPGLKFDARIGKFYQRDRVFSDDNWKTEQHEITRKFEAIFDLENVQRGWINFPQGAAPELVLVPAGEDPGEAPSDRTQRGRPPPRQNVARTWRRSARTVVDGARVFGMQLMLYTIVTLLPQRIIQANCLQSNWRA